MGMDPEATPEPSGQHDATPIPPSIPAVSTSFVGRQDDVERIVQILLHGNARLITLTGPAGAGKTRLALEVATRFAGEDRDGPAFVPLATVESVGLVSATILQSLGETALSLSPAHDQLKAFLQHRHILLVLDNLEHLLDWTGDLVALLACCPNIRILATSQAPLGVEGERVERVPPLALPDTTATPDAIYASDAASLFVARAQAVNPGIAANEVNAGTIAALCRHLDGLPLAIELAAARSSIMNPVSILERLDRRFAVLSSGQRGIPERQRTLHHAISWSYDLLNTSEQRMFRWLSVFSGGISLEAVEAFPPAPDDHDRLALDVLEQLVDRSLIQALMSPGIAPRYVMLESLRAFGREQLLLAGDDANARAWHAAWFAGMVRKSRPPGQSQRSVVAADQLSLEWENIRQAMSWFRAQEDAGAVREMCGDLWRFWSMRGWTTEGREWVRYALAATPDDGTRQRAELHEAAGYLAEEMGDLPEADRSLRSALAIYEELGDPGMVAATVSGLGCIAHDQRDYERAFAWHFRALELADASGDRRSQAIALGNLGGASFLRGDYPAAIAHFEKAAVILVELGDRRNEALLLGNLGAYLIEANDLTAATETLERSLEIVRALDDTLSLAYSLINLGEVHLQLGEPGIGLPMLTEAIDILDPAGNVQAIAIGRIVLARIHLAQGNAAEALTTLRDSLVTFRKLGDLVSAAEAMDVAAAAALELDAIPDARQLLSAAAAIRIETGTEARPSLAAQTRDTRQRVNDRLGPDTQATGSPSLAPDEIVGTALRRIESLRRRVPNLATTPDTGTALQPSDQGPDPAMTANHYGLSNRELDVLRLLSQGKSTRDIADQLCISPRTVATHIANITGKLDVRSRTAAVALAMRLRLV